MLKTTAKVRYRDYVPQGWIAIEFYDVWFYGNRAEEMERKWDSIKYERYATYNSLYEANKTKIQNLYSQEKAIRKQVKDSKPFYRFWHNKAERQMLSEADRLLNQALELEKENNKIKDKRWFRVDESYEKIKDLLKQYGFVLTSISYEGNECVTETEIWTLEE